MTTPDLKVLTLQMDIVWEDIEANLNHAEELIEATTDDFNVILLPEMFSTGFSANAQTLAEPTDGRTICRVRQWAAKFNSLVIGSYIAVEEGLYYNRGFAVTPDGECRFYDKHHLFIGWEKKFFTPGKEKLIFNYLGWNIALFICYDLRFPVWLRNRNLGYDAIFCVTQWPQSRQNILDTLSAARAVENQSYLFICNRVGADGNYIKYTGGSAAYDYNGRLVHRLTDKKEEAVVISVEHYPLISNREKAPVWRDAEDFQLIPPQT